MGIETKICGISTAQAVDAVAAGGAAYIGFIFFEKSPRHVQIDQAAKLASQVTGAVRKVAVSVNADDEYLDQIVSGIKPDMLQLHGSETPQRVADLKARHGLPVMKAFAIHDATDLKNAEPYQGIADRFLFDAKPPEGSELPGGNGVSFDWKLLRHFNSVTPYMLSGGLSSDNIEEALNLSGAQAIDISSGVESSPGIKDIAKVESLLDLVGGLNPVVAAYKHR